MNIKLQFALALISNSKLGSFLGEADPIQKKAGSKKVSCPWSSAEVQGLLRGPISHRGCSVGDRLRAAAGTSGCIHLGAVLAGWQMGIRVLLEPLHVLEVWVRQGAIGRYSFGWIKRQALQK